MKLIETVQYPDGSGIARNIIAQNGQSIQVLMAFDKDASISTHTTTAMVMVQILEGVCEFTVEGTPQLLNGGDYLVMKPGTPHSLRAPERFKMLLTKLA